MPQPWCSSGAFRNIRFLHPIWRGRLHPVHGRRASKNWRAVWQRMDRVSFLQANWAISLWALQPTIRTRSLVTYGMATGCRRSGKHLNGASRCAFPSIRFCFGQSRQASHPGPANRLARKIRWLQRFASGYRSMRSTASDARVGRMRHQASGGVFDHLVECWKREFFRLRRRCSTSHSPIRLPIGHW